MFHPTAPNFRLSRMRALKNTSEKHNFLKALAAEHDSYSSSCRRQGMDGCDTSLVEPMRSVRVRSCIRITSPVTPGPRWFSDGIVISGGRYSARIEMGWGSSWAGGKGVLDGPKDFLSASGCNWLSFVASVRKLSYRTDTRYSLPSISHR